MHEDAIKSATSPSFHEMVAVRAYHIWVAQGQPSGMEQEHWYQAEREIREKGLSGRVEVTASTSSTAKSGASKGPILKKMVKDSPTVSETKKETNGGEAKEVAAKKAKPVEKKAVVEVAEKSKSTEKTKASASKSSTSTKSKATAKAKK